MLNNSSSKLEHIKSQIYTFITSTFDQQQLDHAVIAVSGGIDSAMALTLLTQALGAGKITPVLLPYGDQDMSDAKMICEFNGFSEQAWIEMNIKQIADALFTLRAIAEDDRIRRGNVMARVRMILVFDIAKEKKALVCGTENKSEKYLGYFTRFGDAASDFEPISHLYKTQVQALAQQLGLPEHLSAKVPSAELWFGQTDEQELGFSYAAADAVLQQLIDEEVPTAEIVIDGVSAETISKVLERVRANRFKQQVPYQLTDLSCL